MAIDIDDDDDDDDDDEVPILIELENRNEAHGDNNNPLPTVSEITAFVLQASPPPPCPVTILCGFLGSGKTTLINYILKDSSHGKRIAIIENEFGDGLSVESLIAREGVDDDNSNETSTGSLMDLIELPNGCVCCTVKNSLVQTIEDLVTKKRADLDHIIIECSGMANPGPIASMFWLDEAMESRLELDGIITLVDAKNITYQLQNTSEAGPQIAYADRILLNKVDLVDSSQIEQLCAIIRQLNSTAPVRQTQYSQVPDLTWILSAQCLDHMHRLQDVQCTLQELTTRSLPATQVSTLMLCDCGDATTLESLHSHTASITTITLKHHDESANFQLLNRWLANVLWPHQDEPEIVLRSWLESSSAEEAAIPTLTAHHSMPTSSPFLKLQTIFRIKGIVSVIHEVDRDLLNHEMISSSHIDTDTGIDRRLYLVQAVHDLWTVEPTTTLFDENDPQRQSQLVVIGSHLDRAGLAEGFHACFPKRQIRIDRD